MTTCKYTKQSRKCQETPASKWFLWENASAAAKLKSTLVSLSRTEEQKQALVSLMYSRPWQGTSFCRAQTYAGRGEEQKLSVDVVHSTSFFTSCLPTMYQVLILRNVRKQLVKCPVVLHQTLKEKKEKRNEKTSCHVQLLTNVLVQFGATHQQQNITRTSQEAAQRPVLGLTIFVPVPSIRSPLLSTSIVCDLL